ncbi:MAG TPA: ATP-binding protein [Vicinamibacterales bacterium]|nr:ATP-binding protein [Vicinamibacterales bacterium]
MTASEVATESPSDPFLDEYLAALRAHAGATAEAALGRAYDMGRAAMARRQSLIDIVIMHHRAVDLALTCDVCRDECRHTLRAGGELLAELLSPFDMAQGAFLESNAALRGANDLLEHEAQRVARLLHDSAGQIVFALQLALADIERGLPKRLLSRFGEVSTLLLQLDRQLRLHAHELYPVVLEDLGLAAALRELIRNVGQRAGLAIQFTCSLEGRLPREVESSVYRAIQEALRNTVKHARATEVTVNLELNGPLLACSITDNGIGFAPHPSGHSGPGLGLVGIRERMKSINGTVHLESRRGQGTEVILGVRLPTEEESTWD